MLDGAITKLIEQGEIKGKLNEVSIVHSFGKIPARIVAVAGLGKQDELNLDFQDRTKQHSAWQN